jgi:hypothetical protein
VLFIISVESRFTYFELAWKLAMKKVRQASRKLTITRLSEELRFAMVMGWGWGGIIFVQTFNTQANSELWRTRCDQLLFCVIVCEDDECQA